MSQQHVLPMKYTIPAAGTMDLFENTSAHFFGGDCRMTVYASADLAGDTHQLELARGADAPIKPWPTGPIPVASTPAAAKTNENFIAQTAIRAGSIARLTVSGAAGHTGTYLIVID